MAQHRKANTPRQGSVVGLHLQEKKTLFISFNANALILGKENRWFERGVKGAREGLQHRLSATYNTALRTVAPTFSHTPHLASREPDHSRAGRAEDEGSGVDAHEFGSIIIINSPLIFNTLLMDGTISLCSPYPRLLNIWISSELKKSLGWESKPYPGCRIKSICPNSALAPSYDLDAWEPLQMRQLQFSE